MPPNPNPLEGENKDTTAEQQSVTTATQESGDQELQAAVDDGTGNTTYEEVKQENADGVDIEGAGMAGDGEYSDTTTAAAIANAEKSNLPPEFDEMLKPHEGTIEEINEKRVAQGKKPLTISGKEETGIPQKDLATLVGLHASNRGVDLESMDPADLKNFENEAVNAFAARTGHNIRINRPDSVEATEGQAIADGGEQQATVPPEIQAQPASTGSPEQAAALASVAENREGRGENLTLSPETLSELGLENVSEADQAMLEEITRWHKAGDGKRYTNLDTLEGDIAGGQPNTFDDPNTVRRALTEFEKDHGLDGIKLSDGRTIRNGAVEAPPQANVPEHLLGTDQPAGEEAASRLQEVLDIARANEQNASTGDLSLTAERAESAPDSPFANVERIQPIFQPGDSRDTWSTDSLGPDYLVNQDSIPQPRTNPDGTTSVDYGGTVHDGVGDNNPEVTHVDFNATDRIDSEGRLVERDVRIPEGKENVKIKAPNGQEIELDGVNRINTKYDTDTDSFQTTYHTEDGMEYVQRADTQGNVDYFNVQRSVPLEQMAQPPVGDGYQTRASSAEAEAMGRYDFVSEFEELEGSDLDAGKLIESEFEGGGHMTKLEREGEQEVLEVEDALGRNTKFENEDGRVSSIERDGVKLTRSTENDREWLNEQGEVELRGDITVNKENGDIRYELDDDNRIETWRVDGTHKTEMFGTRETVPPQFDSEGNRLEQKYAQYEIEHDKYGVPTKVIDQDGFVHVPGEGGGLEIDPETGDATIDEWGKKVTFHMNGSRTETDWDGSKEVYDRGGRINEIYGAPQYETNEDGTYKYDEAGNKIIAEEGKLTDSFSYSYDEAQGRYRVDRISNKDGIWEKTGKENGRDVWALKDTEGNPRLDENGEPIFLNADVDINSDNNMEITRDKAIQDSNHEGGERHDIVETEVHQPDGVKIISDSDGNVRVLNSDGSEVHSTEVEYARNADGSYQHDSKGQRIKTGKETVRTSFGDYQVDRSDPDNPTFTELDKEGAEPVKGEIKIGKDGSITIDDRTNHVYTQGWTDGESYTENSDGSLVFRNADGQVTESINRFGDSTAFQYDENGNLQSIRSKDLDLHSFDGGDTFYDMNDPFSNDVYKVDTKLNGVADGDFRLHNLTTGETRIDTLSDATSTILQSDGSSAIFRDGKIIQSRDVADNVYSYTHDADGVASVQTYKKGENGELVPGELIVRRGADVELEPGQQATLADNLEVGTGGEISYQNAGTIRNGLPENGDTSRVTEKDGNIVRYTGDERSPSSITIKGEDGQSDETWRKVENEDGSVDWVNDSFAGDDDARIQRQSEIAEMASEIEQDNKKMLGRLTSKNGNSIGYEGTDHDPSSITSTDGTWTRTVNEEGQVEWSNDSFEGTEEERAARSAEIAQLAEEVRNDNNRSFDESGRMTRTADGQFEFEYSGNNSVPTKVTGPDGTWTRSEHVNENGHYEWTNDSEPPESFTGEVSTENGNFVFGREGDFITRSPDGTTAHWDFNPDHAYGQTPKSLTRQVPDGEGGFRTLDLTKQTRTNEDGQVETYYTGTTTKADGTRSESEYSSVYYDRNSGRLTTRDVEGNQVTLESDGSRKEISSEGTIRNFDTEGRMTRMGDFTFEYRGDETDPWRVKNAEGTWERGDPTEVNDEGVQLYEWTNLDTGYKGEFNVSTKNGKYSWRDTTGVETTYVEEDGTRTWIDHEGNEQTTEVKKGQHIKTYPNGTEANDYNDATWALESEDGKLLEYHDQKSNQHFEFDHSEGENGQEVITMSTNGGEAVEINGYERGRDGLEIWSKGEGGSTLHHKNGATISKDAQGNYVSYESVAKNAEGEPLQSFRLNETDSQGDTITNIDVSEDGRAILTLENGDTRIYNKDGSSLTVMDNNKVKTLSADGRTELEYRLSSSDHRKLVEAVEEGDLSKTTFEVRDFTETVDGEKTRWRRAGADQWTNGEGDSFRGKIRLDANTSNQTIERYDDTGRIDSIVVRDNNARVQSVTDKLGYSTYYQYNDKGELDMTMSNRLSWDTALIKSTGENGDGKWRNPLDYLNPFSAGPRYDGINVEHGLGKDLGRTTFDMTDGRTKTVDANGLETITNLDGSTSVNHIEGSIDTTHTHNKGEFDSSTEVRVNNDGSVDIELGDGTVISRESGVDANDVSKITVTNEDGESTTFNGKVNVDEQGNVTVVNEDNNTERLYMTDGREISLSRQTDVELAGGTQVSQAPGSNTLKFQKDGQELELEGDIDFDRNGNPVVKLKNAEDYAKLKETFGEKQAVFEDGSRIVEGEEGKLTYIDDKGDKHEVEGTLSFDEEGNPSVEITDEGEIPESLEENLEDLEDGETTLRTETVLDMPVSRQVEFKDGATLSEGENGELVYTRANGSKDYIEGTMTFDENGNASFQFADESSVPQDLLSNREEGFQTKIAVDTSDALSDVTYHSAESSQIEHNNDSAAKAAVTYEDGSFVTQTGDGQLTYNDGRGNTTQLDGTISYDKNGKATVDVENSSEHPDLSAKLEGPNSGVQLHTENGSTLSQHPDAEGKLIYTSADGNTQQVVDGTMEVGEDGSVSVKLTNPDAVDKSIKDQIGAGGDVSNTFNEVDKDRVTPPTGGIGSGGTGAGDETDDTPAGGTGTTPPAAPPAAPPVGGEVDRPGDRPRDVEIDESEPPSGDLEIGGDRDGKVETGDLGAGHEVGVETSETIDELNDDPDNPNGLDNQDGKEEAAAAARDEHLEDVTEVNNEVTRGAVNNPEPFRNADGSRESEQRLQEEMQRQRDAAERRIEERERQQAERDRIQAEQDRIKAEQDRIKAEQERIKAEQERIKAEQERIKAEKDRIKKEQERIQKEKDRIKAEKDRIKAEQDRVKKIEDEKARIAEDRQRAEELSGQEKTDLENDISRREGELSQAEAQLSEDHGGKSTAEIKQTLNEAEQQVNADLSRVMQDANTLDQDIESASQASSKLSTDISRIDQSISNLSSDMSRLEGDASELKSSISRLQAAKSQATQAVSQARSTTGEGSEQGDSTPQGTAAEREAGQEGSPIEPVDTADQPIVDADAVSQVDIDSMNETSAEIDAGMSELSSSMSDIQANMSAVQDAAARSDQPSELSQSLSELQQQSSQVRAELSELASAPASDTRPRTDTGRERGPEADQSEPYRDDTVDTDVVVDRTEVVVNDETGDTEVVVQRDTGDGAPTEVVVDRDTTAHTGADEQPEIVQNEGGAVVTRDESGEVIDVNSETGSLEIGNDSDLDGTVNEDRPAGGATEIVTEEGAERVVSDADGTGTDDAIETANEAAVSRGDAEPVTRTVEPVTQQKPGAKLDRNTAEEGEVTGVGETANRTEPRRGEGEISSTEPRDTDEDGGVDPSGNDPGTQPRADEKGAGSGGSTHQDEQGPGSGVAGEDDHTSEDGGPDPAGGLTGDDEDGQQAPAGQDDDEQTSVPAGADDDEGTTTVEEGAASHAGQQPAEPVRDVPRETPRTDTPRGDGNLNRDVTADRPVENGQDPENKGKVKDDDTADLEDVVVESPTVEEGGPTNAKGTSGAGANQDENSTPAGGNEDRTNEDNDPDPSSGPINEDNDDDQQVQPAGPDDDEGTTTVEEGAASHAGQQPADPARDVPRETPRSDTTPRGDNLNRDVAKDKVADTAQDTTGKEKVSEGDGDGDAATDDLVEQAPTAEEGGPTNAKGSGGSTQDEHATGQPTGGNEDRTNEDNAPDPSSGPVNEDNQASQDEEPPAQTGAGQDEEEHQTHDDGEVRETPANQGEVRETPVEEENRETPVQEGRETPAGQDVDDGASTEEEAASHAQRPQGDQVVDAPKDKPVETPKDGSLQRDTIEQRPADKPVDSTKTDTKKDGEAKTKTDSELETQEPEQGQSNGPDPNAPAKADENTPGGGQQQQNEQGQQGSGGSEDNSREENGPDPDPPAGQSEEQGPDPDPSQDDKEPQHPVSSEPEESRGEPIDGGGETRPSEDQTAEQIDRNEPVETNENRPEPVEGSDETTRPVEDRPVEQIDIKEPVQTDENRLEPVDGAETKPVENDSAEPAPDAPETETRGDNADDVVAAPPADQVNVETPVERPAEVVKNPVENVNKDVVTDGKVTGDKVADTGNKLESGKGDGKGKIDSEKTDTESGAPTGNTGPDPVTTPNAGENGAGPAKGPNNDENGTPSQGSGGEDQSRENNDPDPGNAPQGPQGQNEEQQQSGGGTTDDDGSASTSTPVNPGSNNEPVEDGRPSGEPAREDSSAGAERGDVETAPVTDRADEARPVESPVDSQPDVVRSDASSDAVSDSSGTADTDQVGGASPPPATTTPAAETSAPAADTSSTTVQRQASDSAPVAEAKPSTDSGATKVVETTGSSSTASTTSTPTTDQASAPATTTAPSSNQPATSQSTTAPASESSATPATSAATPSTESATTTASTSSTTSSESSPTTASTSSTTASESSPTTTSTSSTTASESSPTTTTTSSTPSSSSSTTADATDSSATDSDTASSSTSTSTSTTTTSEVGISDSNIGSSTTTADAQAAQATAASSTAPVSPTVSNQPAMTQQAPVNATLQQASITGTPATSIPAASALQAAAGQHAAAVQAAGQQGSVASQVAAAVQAGVNQIVNTIALSTTQSAIPGVTVAVAPGTHGVTSQGTTSIAIAAPVSTTNASAIPATTSLTATGKAIPATTATPLITNANASGGVVSINIGTPVATPTTGTVVTTAQIGPLTTGQTATTPTSTTTTTIAPQTGRVITTTTTSTTTGQTSIQSVKGQATATTTGQSATGQSATGKAPATSTTGSVTLSTAQGQTANATTTGQTATSATATNAANATATGQGQTAQGQQGQGQQGQGQQGQGQQSQQGQTQAKGQTQGQTGQGQQGQTGQAQGQTAQQGQAASGASSVIVLPNGVTIPVGTGTGTVMPSGTGSSINITAGTGASSGNISVSLPVGDSSAASGAAAGIIAGSNAGSIAEGTLIGTIAGAQAGGSEGAIAGAITGAISSAINQDNGLEFTTTNGTTTRPGSDASNVSVSADNSVPNFDAIPATEAAPDSATIDATSATDLTGSLEAAGDGVDIATDAAVTEPDTQAEPLDSTAEQGPPLQYTDADGNSIILEDTHLVMDGESVDHYIDGEGNDYWVHEEGIYVENADGNLTRFIASDGTEYVADAEGVLVDGDGNHFTDVYTVPDDIHSAQSDTATTDGGDTVETSADPSTTIDFTPSDSTSDPFVDGMEAAQEADSAGEGAVAGAIDGAINGDGIEDVLIGAAGGAIQGALNDALNDSDAGNATGQGATTPATGTGTAGTGTTGTGTTGTGTSGTDTTGTGTTGTGTAGTDTTGTDTTGTDTTATDTTGTDSSNPLVDGMQAGAGADNAGDGALAGALDGALNGDGIEDVILGAAGGALQGAINDALNDSDSGNATNQGTTTPATSTTGTGTAGTGTTGTDIAGTDTTGTGTTGTGTTGADTTGTDTAGTGTTGTDTTGTDTSGTDTTGTDTAGTDTTGTDTTGTDTTGTDTTGTDTTGTGTTGTGTTGTDSSNPLVDGMQAGAGADNAGDGALAGALDGALNGDGIEDVILGAAGGALQGAINDALNDADSGNATNQGTTTPTTGTGTAGTDTAGTDTAGTDTTGTDTSGTDTTGTDTSGTDTTGTDTAGTDTTGTDTTGTDTTGTDTTGTGTTGTGTGTGSSQPSGTSGSGSPSGSGSTNPLVDGMQAGSGADSAGDGALAGALNGALNGGGIEDVILGAAGGALQGALNDANDSGSSQSSTTVPSSSSAPSGSTPAGSTPTGSTPSSSTPVSSTPASGTPSGPSPFASGLQAGSGQSDVGDGALAGALAGAANGGGLDDALIGAAAGALGSALNDGGNTPPPPSPVDPQIPAPVDTGAFTPVPAPDDGGFDSATISPVPTPTTPATPPPTSSTNLPSGTPLDPVIDPGVTPGSGQPPTTSYTPPTTPGGDPVSGLPIDPNSGLPYDPSSGLLIDPSTGQPMGPVSTGSNPTAPGSTTPGSIDPGAPHSGSSQPLDPVNTGDPVAGKPIDPTTGLPFDPDSNLLLDPNTGKPIGQVPSSSGDPSSASSFGDPGDPVAGKPIDPKTGLPYDPDSNQLLDPNTGKPIGRVDQTDPTAVRPDPSQDSTITESKRDGETTTTADNKQRVPKAEHKVDADDKPDDRKHDETRIEDIAPDGVESDLDNRTNLANVLSDELAKIQESIESRLEELHGTRVSGDRQDGDWSSDEAGNDIASRSDVYDFTSDDQERIDKEVEIKEIKDKLDEDDRRKEEEEERLEQRKREIKKLTDKLMAIIATRRRAELERIRKLIEQQRKIEEFTAKDTKRTTHKVLEGETVEKIAKRIFKDPRVAHLIYEMNPNKITVKTIDGKTNFEVKPGTTLKLPSPREAREYIMRGKYLTADGEVNEPEKLSEEERREIEERRENVEKMLGSLGIAIDPNYEIKYTVRLGDSLRSIAMKHPALNDLSLWRLLAEKNDLPVETDAKGTPTASVKRGQKLVLPSRDEIKEFRRKNGVLSHPSTRIKGMGVNTNVKFAKECDSCERSVPAGVSMCPSCGHIFTSRTTVKSLKAIFSSGKNESVPTTEEDTRPDVKPPDDQGVKTTEDPLAPDAADDTVVVKPDRGVDTAETSGKPVKPYLANASGVDTTPDPLAPASDTTESQGADTADLDHHTVVVGNGNGNGNGSADTEDLSASQTLLQGINDLHSKDSTPSVPAPVSGKSEKTVSKSVEQLSDQCRVVEVETKNGKRGLTTRLNLEVLHEDKWIIVMGYEITEEESVRHEYSLTGRKKKTIKMDLPSQSVRQMVQNDISENWKGYCKRFLKGKKLTT